MGLLDQRNLSQGACSAYKASQGKSKPGAIQEEPYELCQHEQNVGFDIVWNSNFEHFSTQFNESCKCSDEKFEWACVQMLRLAAYDIQMVYISEIAVFSKLPARSSDLEGIFSSKTSWSNPTAQ